jgi:glycerol kinase
MPNYLLALDQGTTSSPRARHRGFGQTGVRRSTRVHPDFSPAGWVEHDPHEISFSQIGVAAEAVGCADIRAGDIAAIGITNQRETTVVWDRKTGEPVHNAIVWQWQDRRTAPLCDKLRADGLTQTVQEKTGLVIDPIFRAPRWPGS